MDEEFPRDGARDVSVSTDVTAEFSEDVRGVDEDTFVLVSSATGDEVPARVFDRGDADTWTLRPDVRLRDDTLYFVELEGGRFGIRDRAGNALRDSDWSFTTARDRSDFTRPRLVGELPRDGARHVSRFADVRARFSEPVRGVGDRTFRLINTRTHDVVSAEVFRTSSSTRWVLEPDGRLARATRYLVVLTSGISDLAGNRLVSTTWTFRTNR